MGNNKNLRTYKKIIFLVLIICLISILLLATVSCNKTLVRGSGNVMSEDRDLSGFSKLNISGSGEIFIEQSDKESLTIIAEDNMIPLIITEVSGGTLNINTSNFSNEQQTIVINTKSIEIHIKVKDLNNIRTSGALSINCSGLTTDCLAIETGGLSNVIMSNIKTNSIDIDAEGTGNYIMAGSTDNLNIAISGTGNCDAGDLESKECKIEARGTGNITVNVRDYLDVFIGGTGNVRYIGDPTIDSSKGLGITGKIINISK